MTDIHAVAWREVGDRRVRERDLIKEAAAIRARETREGDSLSLIERTAVQEGSESGKVWCKRERERQRSSDP